MSPTAVALRTVAIALVPGALFAQSSAFAYRPDRAPAVGTVWHFIKSNRDGTEPWYVDVRVVSPSRIDVLKWRPGGDVVDVEAEMDWGRAMPAHLEQRNTDEGGTELRLEAHLSPEGNVLAVRRPGGQVLTLPVSFFPFHLYGFDFLGLNFALPHLVDPTRDFEAEFADPNRPGLGPDSPVRSGRIRFAYGGNERYRGADCRKYRLTGPFFDGQEGFLWVNEATSEIEAVEHPLRTSVDWSDFKLELRGVETRDAFAWQRYKEELQDDTAPWRVPLARRLLRAYAEGGLDGLRNAYRAARADEPRRYLRELDAVGHALLRDERAGDALRVFELATGEFPDSADAWDGRSEAEVAAGRKEEAARSCRRALALDPSNERVRARLRVLGAEP